MDYRPFPSFSEWGTLPENSQALWRQTVVNFGKQRDSVQEDVLSQALTMARRAAAVDTAAIEGLYSTDRGFTMTVARELGSWELEFAAKGERARMLFEAQLSALDLVIDAATKSRPLTEAWVRSLHEHVCEPQDTFKVLTPQGVQEQALPKGEYKKQPNNPYDPKTKALRHVYAPVDQVTSEMHRLIEATEESTFDQSPAPVQAAYVHYALVCVHPFADGNGRVARALASVYLFRALSLPLLVFADQRDRYLDVLEIADEGDYEPIKRFFLDRSVDAAQLVMSWLAAAQKPALENLAPRLRYLFSSPGDLSRNELDTVAGRILGSIQSAVAEEFRELALPDTVTFETSQDPTDSIGGPNNYRRLITPGKTAGVLLRLKLKISEYAGTETNGQIRVLIGMGEDVDPPFLIEHRFGKQVDRLGVRLENVHPMLTASFELQLRPWLKGCLGELLSDLEQKVLKAREKAR